MSEKKTDITELSKSLLTPLKQFFENAYIIILITIKRIIILLPFLTFGNHLKTALQDEIIV